MSLVCTQKRPPVKYACHFFLTSMILGNNYYMHVILRYSKTYCIVNTVIHVITGVLECQSGFICLFCTTIFFKGGGGENTYVKIFEFL